MNDSKRKTSISWVEPGGIRIRGYRVEDLIGRTTWGEAAYLVLRGELPDERTKKMIEAILVSVIDHGVSPPSTIAAVTVANTGGSVSSAVAAGVSAINQYHGGAIAECMLVLAEGVRARQAEGLTAAASASRLIDLFESERQRVPGFGHRLHQVDPRSRRLFEVARELGFAGEYVEQATALEAELAKRFENPLPINADGAIAALLCELGFPAGLANGLFIIARLPGLIAHIFEEQQRNKPMMTVDAKNYEYDGPDERVLNGPQKGETD